MKNNCAKNWLFTRIIFNVCVGEQMLFDLARFRLQEKQQNYLYI